MSNFNINPIYSICFSEDSRFILVGGSQLKLYETISGQEVQSFEGHTREIRSANFIEGSRYVLSGSEDGTLKLWDVETGECLKTLRGHGGGILSTSVSVDGRFALSGSRDGTLKLWILDWELQEKQYADWDEGARPYLETFLTLHTPYRPKSWRWRLNDLILGKDRLSIAQEFIRQGKPGWKKTDFRQLLNTLGYAGYGWLRPKGVRAELIKMARQWDVPPALPVVQNDTPSPAKNSNDKSMWGCMVASILLMLLVPGGIGYLLSRFLLGNTTVGNIVLPLIVIVGLLVYLLRQGNKVS